jgi:hypothetical protein
MYLKQGMETHEDEIGDHSSATQPHRRDPGKIWYLQASWILLSAESAPLISPSWQVAFLRGWHFFHTKFCEFGKNATYKICASFFVTKPHKQIFATYFCLVLDGS